MVKVLIVGAGPAGLACGFMLKRYGINTIIVEEDTVGGTISNAWKIENFPLIGTLSGSEFQKKLYNIIVENNLNVVYDKILSVNENIALGQKEIYKFDEIVIATGTEPKRLIDFEVSERVVYEYRYLPQDSQNILIYGAGDVGFDSAIRAKEDGKNPTIISKSSKIKAVKPLVEEAKKRDIDFSLEEEIKSVINVGNELKVTTNKRIIFVDTLLICVGRVRKVPEIKTENYYIIGDALHPNYRQTSIAFGDGILTAMKIIEKHRF